MSEFKLKNYSTSVSGERTIAEIEKMLAGFGATAVIKEYQSDGTVYFLAFKIGDMSYKLPANIKGVYEVMYSNKHRYYGRDSMKNREVQAYKVAWRIIKDWLHAQLSLISSGQAEPEQVLFPYAYDGKITLFQKWKEQKLLNQGKKK
jgi:hypothetical protein